MVVINSLADSGHYVEGILRGRGYEITNALCVNLGRHAVIATRKDGTDRIFYVLFKRDLFYTYGRWFDDNCLGETINLEWFEAIERSKYLDKILFVYPEGIVYYITPEEWKSFVDENNTVRVQYGGETTTSVRIDILHRWDRAMTTQELTKWLGREGISERFRNCIINAINRLRLVAGC